MRIQKDDGTYLYIGPSGRCAFFSVGSKFTSEGVYLDEPDLLTVLEEVVRLCHQKLANPPAIATKRVQPHGHSQSVIIDKGMMNVARIGRGDYVYLIIRKADVPKEE